jgi:hypothetical protein
MQNFYLPVAENKNVSVKKLKTCLKNYIKGKVLEMERRFSLTRRIGTGF